MPLENKEIGELLAESMKKIESTSSQDSRVLSDMNNALNWILTLTTVFFVFYTRQTISPYDCLEKTLSFLNTVFFTIQVLVLTFHKIVLIKYESTKAYFLETLKTHFIELKFSIDNWKTKFDFSGQVNIVNFINDFRDGKFVPFPNHDKRPQAFVKADNKIKIYGALLKFSFWTGIVTSILYFVDTLVLLIQK